MPAESITDLALASFSMIRWPRVIAFCAATFTVWWCVGKGKRNQWLSTGVARKVNHCWALVGGAVWFGWLPEAEARPSLLMAAAILFVVLAAACTFPTWPALTNLYHGYAREEDGPQRGINVWSSWLLGIYGLGLIDGLCRDIVITRTAALILGVGDGLAEPVGKRFGRWTYPVLRLPGMEPSRRSVEGSLAAFGGTFLTVVLLFCLTIPLPSLLSLAAVASLVTMIAEAISPRGTDNFFVPVASGLAIWFHPAYVAYG